MGTFFPSLITLFADFFAVPLTDIFNTVSLSFIWPSLWKKEPVTVIPKTSFPWSFADLRNISCTLLVSKVYESFVLNWAAVQVKLKQNQYGGVRGSGTPHMLSLIHI